MNKTPDKTRKRKERIPLPFEKKKVDTIDWLYDKRVGLLTMAVVYLLIGIGIVSTRIAVGGIAPTEYILVDFQDVEELEQDIEREIRERERFEQMFNDVRNMESNQDAQLDAQLRDAAGTQADELYKEAQQVQERMRANRDSYYQGLQEQQDIENRRGEKTTDDSKEKVERKVAGNVTVSFSLKGRSAAYLHIPAYQCENGGSVTVQITVNPSGKVIAAVIDKSSSTTDECLREMAINAARLSRFNVDSSAPDKQMGTISYMFVPQ
ncbi:MAG: TonB family protein [Rikenellaceae bacterium]